MRPLQISADFETALFARFLRHAQISILEIFNIFLWLKFSPSLNSNKNYHFEVCVYLQRFQYITVERSSFISNQNML